MGEAIPILTHHKLLKSDLAQQIAILFRSNGFHGTTMSLISRQTGLGRASIYHHFSGGKVEMGLAALDTIDAFLTRFAQIVHQDSEHFTLKWQFIEKELRRHYNGGKLGCLLAIFSLEEIPAELRAGTKSLFDLWHHLMTDLHILAGASHEDASRLSMRDIAYIQGSLVLSLGQASNDAFEQALRAIKEEFS